MDLLLPSPYNKHHTCEYVFHPYEFSMIFSHSHKRNKLCASQVAQNIKPYSYSLLHYIFFSISIAMLSLCYHYFSSLTHSYFLQFFIFNVHVIFFLLQFSTEMFFFALNKSSFQYNTSSPLIYLCMFSFTAYMCRFQYFIAQKSSTKIELTMDNRRVVAFQQQVPLPLVFVAHPTPDYQFLSTTQMYLRIPLTNLLRVCEHL